MSRMRRPVASVGRLALVLALGAAAPAIASAHPLHSTITELTEDRSHRTVRGTIRVFADDFGTAVAHSVRGRPLAAGAQWDAAALAYVASVFAFTDASGRPAAVRSCGTRRTGDLLWICVEAPSATGLASFKVRNAILCDLFDDQVNVVQATMAGSRRSVLFTKGDRAKPLS